VPSQGLRIVRGGAAQSGALTPDGYRGNHTRLISGAVKREMLGVLVDWLAVRMHAP
jgi:hypothetical protein